MTRKSLFRLQRAVLQPHCVPPRGWESPALPFCPKKLSPADPQGRFGPKNGPRKEKFLDHPREGVIKFMVLVLSDPAGRTVTAFGPFLPSFSSQVQLGGEPWP